MKDKLRELAKWCTQPVSKERAEELSRNDYELGLHQGQKEMGDRILALIDAENDGGAVGEVVEQDVTTCANARGIRHLYPVRTKDDLLKPGTKLYTHPARSGVVSNEDVTTACRKYYNCGHPVYPPVFEGMRAALESYERNRK